LYFYTKEQNELEELIKKIDVKPIIIDIVSKSNLQDLIDRFLRQGFIRYAEMQHMVNPKLRFFEKDSFMKIARPTDVDDLYKKLFVWLDKYTGHFPTKRELFDYVSNKQVIIARNFTGLLGFFIYKYQGNKGDLFQWGFDNENGSHDPYLPISLYFNALAFMYAKGVSNVELWVNSTNKKVIKIHYLNGFRFSGLTDQVLLRK
jgi:hypothetical protein